MIAPTIDGVLLGTAPYMSPEQARGKAVDKRTDIWAFGCVLYEMLTGRRAFGGETTSDTIVSILEREPGWGALPPATPPRTRQLIERCLDKDPKRRLRDIGDARIDLDDVGSAGASRPGVSAVTRPHRERFVWAAACGLLMVILALMLRDRIMSSPANGAPTIARVSRLTSGPAFENGAAISPDGKWVAYQSNERGVTDVWVRFVAGGEPANVTASTNLELQSQSDIGGLAISPDGAYITFDAGPKGGGPPSVSAWVIPAPLGGVPRKLLERGRAVRWSPDGTKIVYVAAGGSGGDALWVADSDGGNAHEIAPKRGGMHKHWPAWSHDGRYIYFNYTITTMSAEPTEIYRVPASGGPIEPVVPTTRRAVFPTPTPDGTGLIYATNPESADIGLWWKPLKRNGEPQRLTIGLGEYAESSIAANGRSLVSTLIEVQRTLIRIPVGSDHVKEKIAPLTSGYTDDLDPTLHGDRLVFSSTRSGNRNIWAARPDGVDARPLTSGAAIDERPAISPDSQRIAFVSDRGGRRGIWVMNADGGAPRSVVAAEVLDTISWSPDGRHIVYALPGEQPGLWLASVADGSVRRLVTPGPAASPAWSPTSDVIAYIENVPTGPTTAISARVAYVTASGQAVHRDAPLIQTIGNGALAWDRAGSRIAAIGNSGAVASVIFMVDPGQRDPPHKLIDFPADVRLRGVTWSPDGQSLIVGQQRRTSDIVLLEFSPKPR